MLVSNVTHYEPIIPAELSPMGAYFMKNVYTPGHVANYILDKAHNENNPVSLLKLLKLVYISYGWVWALVDRRLFVEPFYAWQHGPVLKSLYHEFKGHGQEPIDGLSEEFNFDDSTSNNPKIPLEEEEVSNVLNMVWDVYKGFSGWDLREKTHENGTPWYKVYRDGEKDIEINDEAIKKHFVEKIGQYVQNLEQ